MSFVGIESIIYGVDDLERCSKFFDDFGLTATTRSAREVVYELPEGSRVILKHRDDASLPPPFFDGNGPREIVWGIDSQDQFDALYEDLIRDRAVSLDETGGLHTTDDAGLPIGVRVFARQSPQYETSLENNPGSGDRRNRHRKWFHEAHPGIIYHAVFGTPDVDKNIRFYIERFGFRVSDVSRGFGVFMRCDGRNDHHNIMIFRAPKRVFSHVSFGVENIDELMTGGNHMQRQGWTEGPGFGRHRLSSLVFYYLASPAGGMAEYSADGDRLDDDWKPRIWEPEFANIYWSAKASPTQATPPAELPIFTDRVPSVSAPSR